MRDKAVNRIRRRAYQLPLDTPSALDLPSGLSLEECKDAVIKERSLEFVIENKKLFDLMRTNQFPSLLKLQGKTINENATLFPIPQAEIEANSSLSYADH